MKILTVLFAALLLAGCGDYNKIVDSAMEKACSIEGQTARDAFRAARQSEYVAKDRAICLRCPGEAAVKCTGDPKALPE
jgi:hypothetical protein